MEYIIDFEYFVPNELDIELLLNIENKIRNNSNLTYEEANIFLNNLIYLVRYKINPNLTDYSYKCDLAQSIFYYYFKDLGCNVILNTTQNAISDNIEGHSFLVVPLKVDNQNVWYLVDPTYSQFFKKEECSEENLVVLNDITLISPKPGYFIREEDYKFAKLLLQYGNIILTEEVALMYGNSFYKTKVGNNSLLRNNIANISGKVYINSFIKSGCNASKTREELKNMGLTIESINQLEEIFNQNKYEM